ncbi:uridine phosphorylase [Caldisphaera lagunensis DSM 15908]|uniref:Uridine phosphorylase n=1 Tax=Caldisphaera lagunensis (strain DSM 15908 / JCM 11604 / ANMR 0165 / IC-154) TaxID=1056495 RepID=L0AAT4_CALLD|nr:uridine phosphorylase [Caldisphaera lagunensis]AFZ71028.1 uridine phosphorylase [Caldisphaera lagunensis DSM 15908]
MNEKLLSANRPESKDGRQYHINLSYGEVSKYVLLPGDPDRVEIIASFMDSYKIISSRREYKTANGKYKGIDISITSTGIGGPSISIALEELLRAGANTFIRIGTSGALQPFINVGDLIIGTSSFRLDGASNDYVERGYPATANYEIVNALIQAAESLNVRYHVGIIASTDTFYVGQGRPGFNNYLPKNKENIVEDLMKLNVLAFEMESSTLFTLSQIFKARAGCVCSAVANRIKDEFVVNAGIDDASKVALEATKILYEWDGIKEKYNKKWFYPGLIKL